MTTRGFGPEEMREVGRIIVEALTGDPSEAELDRLLARSRELTAAFPLYASMAL
jgi:glycine/serine hydroxymethyltransferase